MDNKYQEISLLESMKNDFRKKIKNSDSLQFGEKDLQKCKEFLLLRMPAPVFFLSLEFCNFWICYTLWDQTRGNVKRNWLFGRFLLLETNL